MKYGQFFKVRHDLLNKESSSAFIDIFMRSGDIFREIDIHTITIMDISGPGVTAAETIKVKIQSGMAYISIEDIVAILSKPAIAPEVPKEPKSDSPWRGAK